MSTHLRSLGRVLLIVLAGLLLMASPVVRAAEPSPLATPQPNRTEAASGISFIESPSATCVVLKQGSGACTINWSYLYVTSDTGYMLNMLIKINSKIVAYHQGFFQTYFYIDGAMYGDGFRVPCGLPGEGGTPELGRVYSYEIRATATGPLSAVNYGSVTCPADTVRSNLPVLVKP